MAAFSFKRPAAPSTPAPAAPASTAQPVASVPAAAKPVTPVAAPITAPAPSAAEPTLAPGNSTALAVQAPQEVVTDDFYCGIGLPVGEFDVSDLRMPYLSICGPSSETFKADPSLLGQFIFNKTIPLGDTIRLVVFRAEKRYSEDLPYDPNSKVIPRSFKTKADYRAAGLLESQTKDVADLDIAIELPGDAEGIDEVTDLFVGDKAYLLCRYSAQNTSYGKLVPTLLGDLNGFLKGNFINGYYEWTLVKGSGKNLYFYPSPKAAGATSVELRRAIVQRVAPPATQAAA